MSTTNDGGPAFPTQNGTRNDQGMSLRDWFAGMALQGLLASGHFTYPQEHPDGDGVWMTMHLDEWDDDGNEKIHKERRRFDFPEAAWRCADSMIAYKKQNEEI